MYYVLCTSNTSIHYYHYHLHSPSFSLSLSLHANFTNFSFTFTLLFHCFILLLLNPFPDRCTRSFPPDQIRPALRLIRFWLLCPAHLTSAQATSSLKISSGPLTDFTLQELRWSSKLPLVTCQLPVAFCHLPVTIDRVSKSIWVTLNPITVTLAESEENYYGLADELRTLVPVHVGNAARRLKEGSCSALPSYQLVPFTCLLHNFVRRTNVKRNSLARVAGPESVMSREFPVSD